MKTGYAQIHVPIAKSDLADGRLYPGRGVDGHSPIKPLGAPELSGKDCFKQLPQAGKVTSRGWKLEAQGPLEFFY